MLDHPLILPRFSMGIGDRFGRQGAAQLSAFVTAQARGVDVAPVWNKSFREHSIVGTQPGDVRTEADAAVKRLGWGGAYFVDADHISLKNVAGFVDSSNFFTLDVADFVGKVAPAERIDAFVRRCARIPGRLTISGIDVPLEISEEVVRKCGRTYLLAVEEAARIYRFVEERKGTGEFVTEVSMDETDTPQTPLELLLILAAVADAGIPAQTIAPKFSGRFNKGVDYVGDVNQFAVEFEQDVHVIAYAVKEFGLPANLKLSVHSGSDKFSLYPSIHQTITRVGAGLHLKTAGTTWLEEVIGLASCGGHGLSIVQEIYAAALGRFDEMCWPYATVIDIDRAALPRSEEVRTWSPNRLVDALSHNSACLGYNPHMRQLMHVGYKIAAEMGVEYGAALEANADAIGRHVSANIFDRHLRPVFCGG